MIDVTELVGTVFPELSALVIEDVGDAGEVICVRARTRDAAVACPGCGTQTARVHGYCERTVADVPASGRQVLVKVRVRRMRCPALGCGVQTFREQVPGVLDRYQRRTARLTGQVSAIARELAGRASVRLLPALGISASRHTMLRVLLRIPLPALAVPRVLGTGDFALRRGSVYATVLTGAETGRRVDAVEGRTAGVAEKWLSDHPGAEVVCRDGSGAYGEAVRRALPCAVQVSDRWHLWHLLAEAVRKEVAAHCACWAKGMPLQDGQRAATTAERWQQVHQLRSQNVGLLECGRRLGLSMNTVKRYDRASEPQRLQRVPKYRPTLAGPYRDYLRKRRAEDPAVQPAQLLREIRELGYPGSMNLLVRYINQGRLDSDRPHLSPPPGRPHPAHQARPPHRRPGRNPRPPRSRLPRDDRADQPDQLLRPDARPVPGKRGRTPAADHPRPRGRPAPPALLHQGPGPRHPGRHGGTHPAVPQRPHRGSQHQDQNDQKTDVRTRRLRTATPPHPPRLTPRTVTTEYATEPFAR